MLIQNLSRHLSGNAINLHDVWDILLLAVDSEQRDLHGLVVVAYFILAKEVDLHLIMENCGKMVILRKDIGYIYIYINTH